MTARVRLRPLMMFPCNLIVEYEKPKIHVGHQKYGHSPVTMVLNRSLLWHINRLFDLKLSSNCVQTCMFGGFEPEQYVASLQLINVRYLHLTVVFSSFIAFVVAFVECKTRRRRVLICIHHSRRLVSIRRRVKHWLCNKKKVNPH